MTQSSAQDLYTRVAQKIAEIESEMKLIGYWDSEPLPASAQEFQQAFAMDRMTFPQWIQHILIPRAGEIVQQQGNFPAQSTVGVQAIREFDGDSIASRLVSLLDEFDQLINTRQ